VGHVNYAATSDTSNISTEMMVDDDPLLDMDVNYAALSDLPVYVGTIHSCNNENTMHDVSLELSNEVEDDNNHILDIDATPNAYNTEVKIKKIKLVEDDAIVRSEMNSMFKTASYQSEESRAIICRAKKTSLTEVLLTIYTTYHSPFATLLFSWLEHEDVVAFIKSCLWMKPLTNYSFPLGLQDLSLFPICLLHLDFWNLYGNRRVKGVENKSPQDTSRWL
jgi:hypothetical protein